MNNLVYDGVVDTIVFSGGALKGWLYLGVIKALKELGFCKKLKNVCGSSIGAMFATFLAIGLTPGEIIEEFFKKETIEYIDSDIINFMTTQGLIKGDGFRNFIIDVFTKKAPKEMTFAQLKSTFDINLTITGYCISQNKTCYFSATDTPDMEVLTAIFISSALPVLFPPYKYNNQYYYDGALYDALPIHLFEEQKAIAFCVADLENECHEDNCSEGTIYPLELIFNLVRNCSLNLIKKHKNIIFFPNELKKKINWLNLNQSHDDIYKTYMESYNFCYDRLLKDFLTLPAIDKSVE